MKKFFMICFLCIAGYSISYAVNYVQTDLFIAIKEGDLKKVQAAVAKGADVNARDKNGDTPLLVASYGLNRPLVDLLISKGADLNAKNKDGETALTYATREWKTIHDSFRTGFLKFLMQKKFNVNIKNKNGYSPFMLILETGDTDLIKQMILMGADVNTRWNGGCTPLAVYSSNTEIANMLINRGADPNPKGCGGIIPLMNVSDVEIAKKLIAKGNKVNDRDDEGNTPLIHASYRNNTAMIRFLLSKGADVNVKNNEGNTAFSIASNEGFHEIMTLLKNSGADVNVKYIDKYKEEGNSDSPADEEDNSDIYDEVE